MKNLSARRTLSNLFARSPKKRNTSRTKRGLSMERLSDRRMMAADITLSGGVLEINGDNSPEEITVTSHVSTPTLTGSKSSKLSGAFVSVPMIQYKVTVRDIQNGAVQTEFFNPSQVDAFEINAEGGNDVIVVNVQRTATIDGGSGVDHIFGSELDDKLSGGRDRDYIYGRGGNDMMFGDHGNDYMYGGDGRDTLDGGLGTDRMYGQNGNDVMDGGGHTDYLYGGANNDELRGGPSRDFLRGGSGNDRLMGESGSDDLEGSSGNDVLIGGLGADDMHSGTGHDRFLVVDGDWDNVQDRSSLDAQINFISTTFDAPVLLGSNFGWVTAKASTWRSAEIEEVDESFQLLFDVTGNNNLLKKHDGGQLRFVRYGDVEDFDGNEITNVGGWNGGSDIVLINNTFDSSNRVRSVVIHEVGHNFDEQHENEFVDDFMDVGGWRHIGAFEPRSGMTRADDANWSDWLGGGWFYESGRDDEFARTYGQMNPLEDFATAFTAKILTDAGLNYSNEAASDVQDRMEARFDVLDDFFASID